MGRRRARALALAPVLLAVMLVSCQDEEPAPESAESKIIEGGYAAAVEVSGEGQVLVAYVLPPEDDEGTYRSAWRLYDDSDRPVADGSGSRVAGGSALPGLWPLAEGFLIRRPSHGNGVERVDPEGDVSAVGYVDRARPTRPGDVLVSEPSRARARFYRPSDDAVYRLPELPRGVASVAVDRAGGVWVVLGGADPETAYSADGRAPWRRLDHEAPPGSAPGQLNVSGDVALVPLLDQRSGAGGVAGLLTQEVESPGAWTRVDLTGVDTRQWAEPEVAVVAPGRLLLGDWGPRWYVGAAGAWTRVALPELRPHEDFFLEAKGERVFARSSQHPGLRWSDDLGRNWHELAP